MPDQAATVTRTGRRTRNDQAALSPLQREFARLSRQVAQAQQRLQAWRDAPAAIDARAQAELAPALARLHDVQHTLAVQLDALLTSPPKGLRIGAARREALSAYLVELCHGLLAQTRDDTLIAIHDRHSGRSLADSEEDERTEAMDQALAMLDAVFGEGAVRPQPGESDEAFYDRAQHALLQAYAEDQKREDAKRERRTRRRAERKAARDRTKAGSASASTRHTHDAAAAGIEHGTDTPDTGANPSAPSSDAHSARAASLDDPEQRLRALYRRLASALHPDRVADPAQRAERTQAMKRLNAAWDARDLLALLALQADTLHSSAAPAALPDDQARDYIALLGAQLERLKIDTRRAADAATPPDIAIAYGRPRDANELMLWLEMDLQRIQRNTDILHNTSAGLDDPKHRKDTLADLADMAEAELARRAVDRIMDEWNESW